MTELAIIIVSHNTRGDLERCLRSLHDSPPAVAHDIVVVDNASTDGTVEMVGRHWPRVRLIEAGGNIGFARANNVGIRATAGELLLLLNSDTIAPAGAIDGLVAGLRARPDAAAIGPRIVDDLRRPELSFGAMLNPWTELQQKIVRKLSERGINAARQWIERQTRQVQPVDWVTGACLLVRRAEAEAVGLLDERYFMYCEDVDFCAALRARGRQIWFLPSTEIVHSRGRSAATAPGAAGQAYRRSQLSFYAKHHPRWAPWVRLYLRLRGKLPTGSTDKEGV